VSQPELLKLVGQRLEAAGIDYMVTGSIASSLQGAPRATHDVDIVVAVRTPAADGAARLKAVDFWLLTEDAFDRTRFDRRYIESFEGARLPVSRPEDTILMKLRWAAMLGGSEKQFTDALRVYEVQHGRLDEPYLTQWAATLGVSESLRRVRAEACPIE
jgi:hypothetical protein